MVDHIRLSCRYGLFVGIHILVGRFIHYESVYVRLMYREALEDDSAIDKDHLT